MVKYHYSVSNVRDDTGRVVLGHKKGVHTLLGSCVIHVSDAK